MGRVLRALAWGLLLFTGLGTALAEQPTVIQVSMGYQKLVSHPNTISQVAVGNPEVVDVQVTGARQLMLSGKIPGSTNLTVWSRGASAPEIYRVLVADSSNTGYDSQVQTNIRIVEISRTTLKQFGLNFGRNTDSITYAVSPPGTLSGVEGGQGGFTLNSDSGFLPIADAFNIVLGRSKSGFLGTLSALEGKGLAHTLAEPSLVAMSGQSASFLAGGEFPIPVQQDNNSTTIEYKEYGVRLTLSPTVLGPERIVVKVAPEVSELDFSSAVESGGVSVPGLTVRRSDTTVELGDGESFVISGLISSGMTSSVDKFPGLGDIPILGAFFKSTRFERLDKELIMVVTPHIVRPMAKGAVMPPLPGESYRNYDPSSGKLIFLENGRFDPNGYGFSD